MNDVLDEMKKKHEDYTLWFKFGEGVVEPEVIFLCMYVNADAKCVVFQLLLR